MMSVSDGSLPGPPGGGLNLTTGALHPLLDSPVPPQGLPAPGPPQGYTSASCRLVCPPSQPWDQAPPPPQQQWGGGGQFPGQQVPPPGGDGMQVLPPPAGGGRPVQPAGWPLPPQLLGDGGAEARRQLAQLCSFHRRQRLYRPQARRRPRRAEAELEQRLREAEGVPGGLSCLGALLGPWAMEQLDPQRYHTHPEPDTPICVAFLHGTCQFTAGCPRHHTLLPYHWQLRWAESGRWESLPPLLQELLERLYCNPEHHHVMLLHQNVLMTVDMESMTVQPPLPFTTLRRLSTRGVLGGPLHIPYTFYWWDDPCWREYQGAGRTAGDAPSQGGKEAKSEAAASQQPAVQESQGMRQKPRKLRPIFRALVTMLPHLRSFPETCFWGSPTGLPPMQDSQYPTTWASMDPSMDFIQVNLSLDDRTYLIVHQLFHRTLPELKYQLLSVSRVQNRFLWDKYKRKKEYMCRNPVEEEQRGHERHLFHGTAGEAVRGICKHGFDPRLSGKHAAVFGLGTYFTRSASLANRYALPDPQGVHYLFLSKVLVGRWAQGKASLRRPPALQPDNPASDLYDSCVDRVADPSIYILFDSDQCYPYFLLTYRKVEPVIVLA